MLSHEYPDGLKDATRKRCLSEWKQYTTSERNPDGVAWDARRMEARFCPPPWSLKRYELRKEADAARKLAAALVQARKFPSLASIVDSQISAWAAAIVAIDYGDLQVSAVPSSNGGSSSVVVNSGSATKTLRLAAPATLAVTMPAASMYNTALVYLDAASVPQVAYGTPSAVGYPAAAPSHEVGIPLAELRLRGTRLAWPSAILSVDVIDARPFLGRPPTQTPPIDLASLQSRVEGHAERLAHSARRGWLGSTPERIVMQLSDPVLKGQLGITRWREIDDDMGAPTQTRIMAVAALLVGQWPSWDAVKTIRSKKNKRRTRNVENLAEPTFHDVIEAEEHALLMAWNRMRKRKALRGFVRPRPTARRRARRPTPLR